jgi:tetrapyrrole methylase family protein / MazG family protein
MNTITILGLGPGDAGLITRAAWRVLEQAQVVYLRTAIHPTVAELPPQLELRSFDERYQNASDFASIYRGIAEEVVGRAVRGEDVVYAVPGDPLTAEATTRFIRELAASQLVQLRILPGVSFLEPTCTLLGVDPLEHGLQLIDALDFVPEVLHFEQPAPGATEDSWASMRGMEYEVTLSPFPLIPTRPALICQIYHRRVASDLKLSLMERYPATHPITVVQAAGGNGSGRTWTLPLHELDHSNTFDHLTSAYIPALAPLADHKSLDGLMYVVVRLLGPYGCPWDREQTPQSLRATLLAETHEVLEALDADDPHALAEEMGDVLLNILMLAEIARQAGDFAPQDVYAAITAKLIRRHPHVFADREVSGSAEVLHNWEAIKQAEHAAKGQQRGTLDGIPQSLPALATAQELARKAARVGFVWPNAADAWRKVGEEIGEVELLFAAETPDIVALEAELGDLLLASAVAARALGVDAESALRSANRRFRERFLAMEQIASKGAIAFADLSLTQKLELWEMVKSM